MIVVTGDLLPELFDPGAQIWVFLSASSDSTCKTVYIADWKGLKSQNWFIRAPKRSLIINKGVYTAKSRNSVSGAGPSNLPVPLMYTTYFRPGGGSRKKS